MLKNQKKEIKITGQSVVTVEENGSTKDVKLEDYTCTINSENPGDFRMSRVPNGNDYKAYYKDNRAECHEDYVAFENVAFALQDQMIAEAAAE